MAEARFTKQFLSGSTNGRGIKITPTGTAGTTIHTAHATAKDEIYAWAYNSHSSAVIASVEFGGVTDPDDLIEYSIPAGESRMLLPGLILSGGLVVGVFADQANKLTVHGFVNRIDAG